MMITHVATHAIETEYGAFSLSGFLFGDNQQVVLVLWNAPPQGKPTFLRIQYGCLNGTVFRATDCDCKEQINAALHKIASEGHGALVYFADHEAFGLGLASKMQVVAMEKEQQRSFEEIVGQIPLPYPASDVIWTLPHIFDKIGLKKQVHLLSGNLDKAIRLSELGFELVSIKDLEIEESHLHSDALRERAAKKRKGQTDVRGRGIL
jgi:GTP cyclohydrolase II